MRGRLISDAVTEHETYREERKEQREAERNATKDFYARRYDRPARR
jgi:hypothetical protein